MRRKRRKTADERGYGASQRKPREYHVRRPVVFGVLALGNLISLAGLGWLVYWLVTR